MSHNGKYTSESQILHTNTQSSSKHFTKPKILQMKNTEK